MDGFLAEFLQNYIYWGVLVVLLLCGFGLPIPEEVVLILAGYLVYEELARFSHMVWVCLVGVFMGDILIYFFGHHIGNNLIRHPIVRKWISEKSRNHLWAFFQKHGNKTIFLGRFLTGVRAPLFFTAGSIRMSFWNFIVMDGVAALISVPLMLFLGRHFGGHIERVMMVVQRWDQSILFLGLFLFVGILIYWRWRKKQSSTPPAQS